MQVLAVMTRSRYSSPLLPISIDSGNSSKKILYFLNFSEATRKVEDNIKNSRKLLQVLKSKLI